MQEPIIVKGVRVLRPSEYNLLRNELNPDQQIILDSLLLTGMRYEELLRFHDNPDWYSEADSAIHLPAEAVLKGRKIKDASERQRWVRLSIRGKGVIPNLFRVSMPKRVAFYQMLKRKALKALDHSGLNPLKISNKTTRKTMVSWLRTYYPNASDHIFLSMGHTNRTELRHYLGIPFSDEEKMRMKEWVEGWI